jgi:cysteine sulfinate desulfinase/cysteine desulfurase-like protein
LTARLGDRLLRAEDGVRLLGDGACRAPGLLIVAVRGVRSEVLLHTMEKYGLFASAGSACHSTRREPPACLVDDGLALDEAVVRFSPGPGTTEEDVEDAARIFETALREVRSGTAGRTK